MNETTNGQDTFPRFLRAAVEVLPSGIDDTSYRLEQNLDAPLVESVERTLDATNGSVELLCPSYPTYTGVILTATPHLLHNSGHAAPTRSTPEETATETLCTALSETLPGWIGLVRGPLRMDDLGYAPLRTARVVATDGEAGSSLGSVLEDVFISNHQRGIATVTQLLITSGAGDSFEVTLRVGEATGESEPLGRHTLTAAVDAFKPDGLARVLPDGLRSSRTLAADAWTTRPSRFDPDDTWSVLHAAASDFRITRQSRRVLPDVSPKDQRRLALLTSADEYDALLAGQPAVGLYGSLDVEPTLRLDGADLRSLLAFVPLYSGCEWPSTRGGPLRVAPETVVSTPVGSPDPDRRAAQPTRSDLSEQSDPLTLIAMATRWLREAGCAVTPTPDRTWGEPHLRGAPASATTPVIIVDPEAARADTAVETAGEVIMAANQARQTGDRLFVVTPTKEAARWATEILAVPFRGDRTDAFTAWYTLPTPVSDRRGGVVLTAAGTSPRWTIDATGRRRLSTRDRCLVASPAHVSPTSLTYSAPRVVVDGPQVTVVHPDGDTEAYNSVAACREQYRAIPWPVDPIRPTFLGSVTVVYRDGHRFRTLSPRRRWDSPSGLDTELGAAVSSFIEQYTVPASTPLGPPAVEPVFDRWLHAQIPYQPPELSLFGQLPSEIDATHGADNRLVLQDRSWRVPSPMTTHALSGDRPQST